MTGLGEKIKKARQSNGLTQSQLASKLGVSVSTVARWEHGTNSPSGKDFEKLSKILGVDINSENPESTKNYSSLEMQLEDIRLELANAQRSKRRMLYIIIAIVLIFAFLFFLLVYRINWIDPNRPDEPATIIYYDVKEGDI